MSAFKDFVEQQDFVESIINEFDQQPVQAKPWSAKKPEIMQMWQNLRSDTPIYMTPISKKETGVDGQSYGEDGIRITGSYQFIASVLGRIKDLLAYENPQTKLRLVFRGVDKMHSGPDKNAFVFYVNVENRGQGKSGRPKKLTTVSAI
jgi:hypothetical protein